MKKIKYETPIVEMVNARVEKGFAGSGVNGGHDTTLEHIHDGGFIGENNFD